MQSARMAGGALDPAEARGEGHLAHGEPYDRTGRKTEGQTYAGTAPAFPKEWGRVCIWRTGLQ